MANNYVMESLLKKYNAEDMVKTVVNKSKPLGVYFSKSFIKSRPGFIDEFNNLLQTVRSELK